MKASDIDGDLYLHIDGDPDKSIPDFDADFSPWYKYVDHKIRLVIRSRLFETSHKFQFDSIMLWKLCGFWNWVMRYCPNRRLTYLMVHGKNRRVKIKNFQRAIGVLANYIAFEI